MKNTLFRICIIAVVLLTAFPLAGQTTKVSQQIAEQVARVRPVLAYS